MHVGAGADRVVRIEHRLDGPLAEQRRGDAGGDPLAGHVGQLLVHELRRIGPALADEVMVEPSARDALELAEQVQLRLLAGVAPRGFQQPSGQVKEQRRLAEVAGVDQVEGRRLADDPLVEGGGRADQIGGQFERRVVVEPGVEALVGKLDPVAGHPREADLAGVAFRG